METLIFTCTTYTQIVSMWCVYWYQQSLELLQSSQDMHAIMIKLF